MYIVLERKNLSQTHVHIVGHISHNEDKFWSPHLSRDICVYNNYVSIYIIELYYTDFVYVSLNVLKVRAVWGKSTNFIYLRT